MKKFVILSLIALFVIALHANGACLLQNIQKKNSCTGGASNINPNDINVDSDTIKKQELQKMYNFPTMSAPNQFDSNGFPILNQNCMFGACFPNMR